MAGRGAWPLWLAVMVIFLVNYLRAILDTDIEGVPARQALAIAYAVELYAAYWLVRHKQEFAAVLALYAGHISAMAAALHLLDTRIVESTAWAMLAVACLGVAWAQRDRLLRTRFWQLGGGLSYATGPVDVFASVKGGNSVGDAAPEARAHQMSVEPNVASVDFLGQRFHFIDCPGSVEFMHEMRHVLPAVDAAVVVCEADERKIPALELVLRELEEADIPRFLFLNKIDTATRRVRDALRPRSTGLGARRRHRPCRPIARCRRRRPARPRPRPRTRSVQSGPAIWWPSPRWTRSCITSSRPTATPVVPIWAGRFDRRSTPSAATLPEASPVPGCASSRRSRQRRRRPTTPSRPSSSSSPR
jgi:hypothetical protein